MRVGWSVCAVVLMTAAAWGSDAVVVNMRAKCSGKKVALAGRVEKAGEWPATIRVELVDAQGKMIASASDTVREASGLRPLGSEQNTTSFQVELSAPRKHKFQREELAKARVRYTVLRARRHESEGSEWVVEMCPKVAREKKWWERW